MEERLLSLLRLALKYGATDIHFDIKYGQTVIDMRIDGEFNRVKSKVGDDRLIRYLQYLANLDVGHLLEPQTGTFEMEVDGKLLSLRFAVINSINYTNGVLRILNNKKQLQSSYDEPIKKFITNFTNAVENKISGLYVIGGATGVGKTTLAYDILESLKNKKIFSLEDPIEVYKDSIVQLAINKDVNFDWNEGLRQIARHAPDAVFVGELQDDNAAEIFKAAEMGNVILTTTHAISINDCMEKLSKLNKDSTLKALLRITSSPVVKFESELYEGKK